MSSTVLCQALLLLVAVSASGQSLAAGRAVSPQVVFEENQGQLDGAVRFVARTRDCEIHFAATRISFVPRGSSVAPSSVTIEFEKRSRVIGEQLLPIEIHDYRGRYKERWKTHIRGFSSIRYEDVGAGIDLLFRANGDRMEFDVVTKPGGRPENFVLRLTGTGPLQRMEDGGLTATTKAGDLVFHAPDIYQQTADKRVPVDGGFDIREGSRIGFRIGPYDKSRPLIIDPVLTFSSYWRGSDPVALALDPSSNLFLVQTDNGSIAVSKFTSDGSLVFLTTLSGGSVGSVAGGAASDASGNLYVAGSTGSPDFPVTTGAVQTIFRGPSGSVFAEGFIAKLAPNGQLVYSTFLGGSQYDQIHAIAVDERGSAYVAGQTNSTDLPLVYRLMPTCITETSGLWDAFVAKVSPNGSALLYATYLCGTGTDIGTAIAVGPDETVYVAGTTTSVDFPTTPGALDTTIDNSAGFVTKLSRIGTPLVYSTYLPGAAVRGIGLDAEGSVYVTGFTDSRLTQCDPAIGYGGSNDKGDVFLDKLSGDGSRLLWSKLLGGSGDDCAFGIGVTPSGTAVVAGKTYSADYPVKNAMHPFFTALHRQVVVSAVDSAGEVIYSTHWGGSADGTATAIAVDRAGNAYIAGSTFAEDLPLFDPLLTTRQSQLETTPFISAFSVAPSCADLSLTLDASTDRVVVPGSLTYTITVTNRGPQTASDVALFSDFANFVINTPDLCVSRGYAGMFKCSLGTLAPGANAVITVRGDVRTETIPQEVRLHAESSVADCDLSNNSASVQVTGLFNGKLSGYILPLQHSSDFPDTRVDLISTPSTIAIINLGTQPLALMEIAKGGKDADHFISTTDCGSTLPVGGHCGLTVRFAPLSSGPKEVEFTIRTDDIRAVTVLPFYAQGVKGAPLLVTPTRLVFPEQNAGTISAPQTIQVKNQEDSILKLVRIEATGEFAYSHTCEDDRLASLNSCQFNVTFRPSSAGSRSGTLTIADNTGDPPYIIDLSGTARAVIGSPAPLIDSLSPFKLDAGAAVFALTVVGTGFVNGTAVWWNGSARTTTFVSSTHLTASILAADVARPGPNEVTVFNPGPGGGLSNALVFSVDAGPRRRSVRH